MINIDGYNESTQDFLNIPNCDLDYLVDKLIDIDISKDIKNCKLNAKKFQEGIDDVSRLCGGIVALYNVGINPHKAMDYLTDKQATEFISDNNIKIAEITSKATIEASKQEGISLSKQTI